MAAGTDGVTWPSDACNGVVGSRPLEHVLRHGGPTAIGSTGTMYYWVGVSGTIFSDTADITDTDGLSQTPGGSPIQ